MSDATEAHQRIAEYHADLTARMAARKAWLLRHPNDDPRDWGSKSPDPYPITEDVLTQQRFVDLMTLILGLYQ